MGVGFPRSPAARRPRPGSHGRNSSHRPGCHGPGRTKVKILDRTGEPFLAVPNLARRNPNNHEEPDDITGNGANPETALDDFLKKFVADVRENSRESALTALDYEWTVPEEF
jgi:hypothetical protein